MSRNVSFSQLPMRTTSNQPTLTINEQEQLHRNTRGSYNPTLQTVHGYTSQVQERPPNSYWQSDYEKQTAVKEATQAYWRYGPGAFITTTGREFELKEEQAGNGLINVIACFATIGCGIILASIAKSMMFGAKKSKRKSKKGKSKKGKSKKGKSKKGKSKKGKSKRKY